MIEEAYYLFRAWYGKSYHYVYIYEYTVKKGSGNDRIWGRSRSTLRNFYKPFMNSKILHETEIA